MRFCLAILLALPAFAGQNVSLTNSRLSAAVPAQTHQAVIVEFPIAGWSATPTANKQITSLNAVGVYADWVGGGPIFRIYSLWNDGAACQFSLADLPTISGKQYAWARFIIDPVAMTDTTLVYDVDSNLLHSCVKTYTTDPGTYNSANVYIGDPTGEVREYAFVRARLGSTTYPARRPAAADSGTYLFNYQLNGTVATALNDSGGNGYTLGVDSGTPSYNIATAGEAAYAVVTGIGETTWKAGVTQQVTGVDSFSDLAAITGYSWVLNSGPGGGTFSSSSVASPTMSPISAGDYNVTLTVTDAAANTGSVTEDFGAVTVNASDVVVFADDYLYTFLGPRMRRNSTVNPWPVFDQTADALQALRAADFASLTGGVSLQGASPYDTTKSWYEDYSTFAGTVTATRYSYLIAGSGTSLKGKACAAGSTTAYAAVISHLATYPIGTYNVTASNNKLALAFDGGSTVTVTLTTGSARTLTQIAAEVQTAIGSAGTAEITYTGYLMRIKTATVGTGGSVAVQSVANDAYTLLGLRTATYTVANVPIPSAQIVIAYSTGAASPANIGHWKLSVLSCNSDAEIVAEQANGLAWRLPTAAAASYVVDPGLTAPFYLNQVNNANYYGNDLADYAKAKTSGLTADLTLARAKVDRWWAGWLDQGAVAAPNGDSPSTTGEGSFGAAKNWQVAGAFLRALDGRSDMWAGLQNIVNVATSILTGACFGTDGTSGIHHQIADCKIDQREFAYNLMPISLNCLYNPNATLAHASCADLVTIEANTITPSRQSDPDPYFPVVYYSSRSYETSPIPSACVTNGSGTVTFTNYTTPTAYGTNAFGGSTVWFFPGGGTRPASNSAGDATWYYIVRTGSNTAKLQKPFGSDVSYGGTTKCGGPNAGFVIFDAAADVPVVGWGCQPFMCGLLGKSNFWAYLATSSTNCVAVGCAASAALYSQYVTEAATWIINNGYITDTGGVFQYNGFLNCPNSGSITALTHPLCYASNEEGGRVIAQEGLSVIDLAYRLTGNATYKTVRDSSWTLTWANVSQMPNYQSGGGYSLSTYAAAKYYGLLDGIDGQGSWPAARLCSAFPCLGAASLTRSIFGGGVKIGGGRTIH